MIVESEWAGAAIVMGSSLVVLFTAEAWNRLGTPKPEWTRKLVHVGGGLACLPMPFLISSVWTVLGMALSFAGLLWAGGRLGFLRGVHSVRRKGSGSEFYPFAILVLYVLARDQAWLYVASVLVLATSDALAALVGSEYGVIRYDVDGDWKSLEGSLVFAGNTFVAVHLPVLLLTDAPRPTCVLVASMTAVLVTTIEALSPRGTDNLFVPFAVYFILVKAVPAPVRDLVQLNVMMFVIFGGIAFVAWRTRAFNVGGTLAFILFTFVLWALGSPRWALPVFSGFLLYTIVRVIAKPPPDRPPITRVNTVVRALTAPLLVHLGAYFSGVEDFFYGPFVATTTAVLGFTLWNFVLNRWPLRGWRRRGAAAFIGAVAVAASAVPAWWFDPGASRACVIAIAGLVIPATVLNDALMGPDPKLTPETLWPTPRFVLSVSLGAATIALQVAGVMPAWRPA